MIETLLTHKKLLNTLFYMFLVVSLEQMKVNYLLPNDLKLSHLANDHLFIYYPLYHECYSYWPSVSALNTTA